MAKVGGGVVEGEGGDDEMVEDTDDRQGRRSITNKADDVACETCMHCGVEDGAECEGRSRFHVTSCWK